MQSFDAAVFDTVEHLKNSWAASLANVEFVVSEVPREADLAVEQIHLGTIERRDGCQRVIIFRRPIELRSEGKDDVEQLVFQTVVEQVAELLGLEPAEVDDEYGSEA